MSDQNQKQGYEKGYSGHVDSDYLDNAIQSEILRLKHQTYSMMRAGEGHTVLDVCDKIVLAGDSIMKDIKPF